jgi:hypothetical protein
MRPLAGNGERRRNQMIDWTQFDATLAAAFCERRVKVGDGIVLTGAERRPLLGHELLGASSDTPEEREEIATYEWWPASILELLEQRYRPEQWFGFYWDSIGPMSWSSSLWLLHRDGGSSIVALLHEEQPFYLLGLVDPDDDPLLLSPLFSEIVKENGRGFGVDLFGSLPIETTNWRPDLVPQAVVKQSYWDWMEWAEEVEGSAWVNLEETLAIYELEPNPMKRAFAAFTGLPDLNSEPAIQTWLGDRDAESAGFPDHSKQSILDWYFQRRYTTE